jgi:isopenicillin N synthase-like dioxygenase
VRSVPIIDLAPYRTGDAEAKAALAREVDRACREIGFLVVSGHGVAPEVIAAIEDVSRRFFDLPLEAKERVARPAPDISRGYVGLMGETVGRSRDRSATVGDLNESFIVGPLDIPEPAYAFAPEAGHHFAPNLWPAELPDMEPAYRAYYAEVDRLAVEIMRLFALALDLPEHHFDLLVDKTISRIRVRNYPEPEVPPLPGQLRAGAHSDYGTLTILLAEDRPGGLQVCTSDGEWVDVPITPGPFIVNIGDLMARWTNDRWVSTLHRVVNPPDERRAGSRRQSIVYFHNPNYDAEIRALPTCVPSGEAPRYEPTTSGEHLRRLFTATQNSSSYDPS